MSELRELYQETILDHGKNPRNFRSRDDADQTADGHNPLCGDKVTVYVKLDGETVEDVSFQGVGCAISTASASMMTEALRGKTLDEVNVIFAAYHDFVTGCCVALNPPPPVLGKLVVFAGVREFPMRVKCATLAWHTLRAALDRQNKPVSTE
jgi:nitrogen fixation NifU-like protein